MAIRGGIPYEVQRLGTFRTLLSKVHTVFEQKLRDKCFFFFCQHFKFIGKGTPYPPPGQAPVCMLFIFCVIHMTANSRTGHCFLSGSSWTEYIRVPQTCSHEGGFFNDSMNH